MELTKLDIFVYFKPYMVNIWPTGSERAKFSVSTVLLTVPCVWTHVASPLLQFFVSYPYMRDVIFV
jgi:hypothetical protein